MADTGGPAPDIGWEARVARLESDVAYTRGDIAEIKATLNRIAPLIDEFYGFLRATLPNLVTKAELADLRTELKSELADLRTELKSEMADLRTELKSEMAGLRLEIVQRPTRRQSVFDIFAVVALIGAIVTIASRFAH
jgi:hypothetical protein